MDNSSILWLFLVFFMLHEFEEMIYLNNFLKKNREYLENRLSSKTYSFMKSHLNSTVEQFTFAVCEEFIFLSILIAICVIFSYYSFFVAVVCSYLLHVFVHIIQSIYIKKYIPAVCTGVVSGIYCVVCIFILDKQNLIIWKTVGFWIPIVVILIVLNLKLANYLARIFANFK